MAELLARAQEAGQVRDDLEPIDVFFLITAAGHVSPCHFDIPDLWRRYLGVMLDGIRPAGASPLSPPAPTPAELEAAIGEPGHRVVGLNRPREGAQALEEGLALIGVEVHQKAPHPDPEHLARLVHHPSALRGQGHRTTAPVGAGLLGSACHPALALEGLHHARRRAHRDAGRGAEIGDGERTGGQREEGQVLGRAHPLAGGRPAGAALLTRHHEGRREGAQVGQGIDEGLEGGIGHCLYNATFLAAADRRADYGR